MEGHTRIVALTAALAVLACGEGRRTAGSPPPPPPPDGGTGPDLPAPPPFVADPRTPDPSPPTMALPPPRVGPGGDLEPVWTHAIAGDRFLDLLALDAEDNLYWVERGDLYDTELVSADRDGAPRLRTRVDGRTEDLFLAGDRVVLLGTMRPNCAGIEVRSASTGALSWRYGPELDRPFGTCVLSVRRIAALDGAILAAVDHCTSVDRLGCDVALEALALGDGRLLRSTSLGRADVVTDLVVDEDGNAIAVLSPYDAQPPSRLASVGGDGDFRFDVALEEEDPHLLAVASNGLVTVSGDGSLLLDAARGTVATDLDAFLGHAAIAGSVLFAARLARWPDATLAKLRLGKAVPEWEVTLTQPPWSTHSGVGRAGPILTTSGTLLVVEQPFLAYPDTPVLEGLFWEVDVAGRVLLRLPFAGNRMLTHVALGRGRLFFADSNDLGRANRIRAFDLPGRAPAARGWNGRGGSMARGHRAR